MWNEINNKRRCDLIDKEINHSISDEENKELDVLQQQMLDYRQSVCPLPIAEIHVLLEEIKLDSKNIDEFH